MTTGNQTTPERDERFVGKVVAHPILTNVFNDVRAITRNPAGTSLQEGCSVSSQVDRNGPPRSPMRRSSSMSARRAARSSEARTRMPSVSIRRKKAPRFVPAFPRVSTIILAVDFFSPDSEGAERPGYGMGKHLCPPPKSLGFSTSAGFTSDQRFRAIRGTRVCRAWGLSPINFHSVLRNRIAPGCSNYPKCRMNRS